MPLVIYTQDGMGATCTLPLQEPLGINSIAKASLIRASGYELEFIKVRFSTCFIGTPEHAKTFTIPMVYDATSMIWWGDTAKTILSNL